MYLAERMASVGRSNNFNLIRMVAALSVLISHSFTLALGNSKAEPFSLSLGLSLGKMAVDVFFIASGFLICGSLISRGDAVRFFCSRVLRIYPGLLVMLMLTSFVLGPLMTDLPLGEYLSSPLTWSYPFKTAIFALGTQVGLPGVFYYNPYPIAVNGSLWTLRFEILMYGLIFLAWFGCRFLNKNSSDLRRIVFLLGFLALLGHWLFCVSDYKAQKIWLDFVKLFSLFFLGAAVRLYPEKFFLSKKLALIAVVCIFISSFNQMVFKFVWPISIIYLVFFVAYAEVNFLKFYESVGDYSYGLYIYAFPMQQIIADKVARIGVAEMVFYSMLVTMPFAIVSWHKIESKALDSIPLAVVLVNKLLGKAGFRFR